MPSTNNKKTASEDALQELHKALADDLAKRIKEGTATAADLNVARQFLKDNGVDAVPRGDSPLNDLINILPFPSAENVAKEDGEGRLNRAFYNK